MRFGFTREKVQVAEERLRGLLLWADSHEERSGGGGGRGNNAEVHCRSCCQMSSHSHLAARV